MRIYLSLLQWKAAALKKGYKVRKITDGKNNTSYHALSNGELVGFFNTRVGGGTGGGQLT